AVAISPDAKFVAAGGGYFLPQPQGWLQVWDVATGKAVWNQPVSGTTVLSLAFHPKGQFLAAGHGLGTGSRYSRKHTGYVRLHRLNDGVPLGTAFGEQDGSVNAMGFDREGRRLAVAHSTPRPREVADQAHEELIEIWDPETRVRVLPLTGHAKHVYCIAFHPD